MGKQWKTVRDFIFLGSKIPADGDCPHEIKRHLLLGRKAMTNLDSILSATNWYLPVNYKLALACQLEIAACQEHLPVTEQNSNKGISHLPLWRLNPVLLQLLTFNTPLGNLG